FGLESSDHLTGVHAGLEYLEGHLAPHRFGLLGHEDDAEAAFTDLLQKLVGADHRARTFVGNRPVSRLARRGRKGVQETTWCLMSFQQGLDPTTPLGSGRPLPVEERRSAGSAGLVGGCEENRLNALGIYRHDIALRFGSPSSATSAPGAVEENGKKSAAQGVAEPGPGVAPL